MTTLSFLLSILPLFLMRYSQAVYYHPSFELLKPVVKPSGVKPCTVAIINRKPFTTNPFKANFTPPSACGQDWSLVTLQWSAGVKTTSGNEATIYAATVFFGGVTVLKTTTASTGRYFSVSGPEFYDYNVSWSFETDITQFAATLKKNVPVNIYLNTIVGGSGILSLNLSLALYPGVKPSKYADTVLPLSRVTGTSTVSPFLLNSNSKSGTAVLGNIPRNVYRAQVKISQIQFGNDQEYWRNYPQQLLNLLPQSERSRYTSGGVFKETLVYIDGLLAGATWQYPVLLVNSINIFLWTPAVGIGAYVLPDYTIDITPFVGRLVDGKNHSIKLLVVNPVTGGFWDVSGSLHLWLDKGTKQTSGKLTSRQILDSIAPSVAVRVSTSTVWGTLYYNLNATTRAQRSINITGTVSTSFGTLSVASTGGRYLENINQQDATRVLENQGVVLRTKQIVSGFDQVSIVFKNGTKFWSQKRSFAFPLSVYQLNTGDTSSSETAAILLPFLACWLYLLFNLWPTAVFVPFGPFGSYSHGFNFNGTTQVGKSAAQTESLTNQQQGYSNTYRYSRDHGSNQTLVYRSSFNGCYRRNYSQTLGTVKYDKISFVC